MWAMRKPMARDDASSKKGVKPRTSDGSPVVNRVNEVEFHQLCRQPTGQRAKEAGTSGRP